MRNPVHSRHVSSKPPRPRKSELPSAANSGSVNTSPTVEKSAQVEVASNEVEASRFWATTLWTWTEQNVTVGVPERVGPRSSPRTTNAAILPRVLAGRGLGDGEDSAVGLERVLVEQDSEIGAARVRDEMVRDSRNTGSLEDDRMKSTAGRRKDLRGILARWVRVPLEHRDAVLVMHEVAVRVEEGAIPAGSGLRKTHHQQNVRHRFREWKRDEHTRGDFPLFLQSRSRAISGWTRSRCTGPLLGADVATRKRGT